MPSSRFGVGRVVGLVRLGCLAVAVAVASATMTVASVAMDVGGGHPPAGASGCGMQLGTTQLEGALGSLFFVTTVVPAVPGQVCNATISVTATIATAGELGRPTSRGTGRPRP